MAEVADALIGRRLGSDGQYRITAILGRGGMATVYRAEHRTAAWARPVAIKVLTPDLTSQAGFTERFQREAGIVATLRHPNILTAFDYGQTDGLLYLVMDVVEGGTLQDILQIESGQPWTVGRAQQLADQILPALGLAHKRGIVHRDIKPSNILIDHESGFAFLSDFGIAKLVGDDGGLMQTRGFIGTPAYASPEQVTGQAVDGRADLYSFGILLFRLIAGRLPYAADEPIALALLHVQAPAPAVRSFNPNVSPAMEAILTRALSRSPDERYQSADELRQALAEAVTDRQIHSSSPEPTRAAPVPRPGEFTASVAGHRPWLRPAALAGAAMVALAVAAGGLYLTSPLNQPRATAPVAAATSVADTTAIPTAAPTARPLSAAAAAQPTLPPTRVPTTVPPAATPPPTATPSGPTPTPIASPGTFLIQDDFADRMASQLPQTSTDPSRVTLSIENGEYRVQTHDPTVTNELVRIPGTFGDTSLEVDARLAGDTAQRLLMLGCRGNVAQGGSLAVSSGYYLFLLPGSPDTPGEGSIQLLRRDANTWAPLSDPSPVTTQPADRFNHIQLQCIGTDISAWVGPSKVVNRSDGTYTAGVLLLGVGANAGSAVTSDARFSNLVVTQQ